MLGLLDLDGGSTYVRTKIAEYFNDMLAIGIDGKMLIIEQCEYIMSMAPL